VFDYIEAFYNPIRLHSGLGYASPIQHEKMTKERKPPNHTVSTESGRSKAASLGGQCANDAQGVLSSGWDASADRGRSGSWLPSSWPLPAVAGMRGTSSFRRSPSTSAAAPF
jgi:hypothetical protein